MDAKLGRIWLFAGLLAALLASGGAQAADYRTQNFLVMAPTPDLARAVGDAAERYRRELAVYWLGGELRPWPNPCPIRVIAGEHLAAQGVTTFHRAPIRDFQMEVVGSPERILDSVLPHEVTHTVLATYFGRPLPRWADEGICTTVEHDSERRKHEAKLREFLHSRRGIAMNKLFLMTEYPSDVLPMYAQGYSVCQFLIAQNGPRSFIQFIGDYMNNPSWTQQVQRHYGYESLAELQDNWLAWVDQGSGPVDVFVKQVPGRGPAIALTSASSPAAPAAPLPGLAPRPQPPVASGAALPQSLASSPASSQTASWDSQTASWGNQGDSWYGRQRQQAATTRNATSQPGHVQTYTDPDETHTAAQPQAEQGLSSGGVIYSPAPQMPTPSPPAVSQPGRYQPGRYQPGSVSQGGTYWR